MEDAARRFLDGLLAACRADPRILGVTLAGSAATGQMDEFSDVDTATIGDHSAAGCAGALRAAIALYRELRDPAVERRAAAEEASVAYLEEVASRAARASR
jgi:predicted nucleotidyltransferase